MMISNRKKTLVYIKIISALIFSSTEQGLLPHQWLISLHFNCIPYLVITLFNPFQPEFTIVIFIHYKPRIAVAILDL